MRLHARLLTYSRPVSSCALCPHRSVPPFLTQEGAAAPKTDTQGSGDKPGGRQEPLCPRVPDALVRGVGALAVLYERLAGFVFFIRVFLKRGVRHSL